MPLDGLLLEGQRASLLAVDDTPAILDLLTISLGGDYDVVTVESGQAAISAFSARRFDLVLLDLMMPDMDGFETLRQLQALPGFAGTPVVFLTAMDDLASECSALELGADDYITKPFKPNLVRLRIGNLLHRVRLQRMLTLALSGAEQGLWAWLYEQGELRVASNWSLALSEDGQTKGNAFAGWAPVTHPDDAPLMNTVLEDYLAGTSPAFDADVRLRCVDGQWHWFSVRGKRTGDGVLMGAYRNIDDRKLAELQLRQSETRYCNVMNATGEGIWEWSAGVPVLHTNSSFLRMLGLPLTDTVGLAQLAGLVLAEDVAELEGKRAALMAGDDPWALEFRIRHQDGHALWVALHGQVVERMADGRASRMVGALQDISQKKMIEEEFRRLALFDALTGLPNRRLLIDRMHQAISGNRRHGSLGALMFIDMDRFKALNDTLGHDYGDMLLVEVGRRLQATVRGMDTVARLGGDEFVVILADLPSDREAASMDARRVGEKILGALGEPYALKEHRYESTPSIGLCLFGSADGEDVEAILRRADNAMYSAKRAGCNQLSVAED
ncbi:two-component system response regulator [Azonexus hydrophilus]|uniref:two-component system response regulator n=1 Tax=Azonexus hydrophilus TaxID=418702 RepID=UPI002493A640|nr:diguanylate cyclase [Azonexus hydrophilus]